MQTNDLSAAFLTVPDAGQRARNVKPAMAYRLARRGELPTVVLHGRLLVPVADLAAMYPHIETE